MVHHRDQRASHHCSVPGFQFTNEVSSTVQEFLPSNFLKQSNLTKTYFKKNLIRDVRQSILCATCQRRLVGSTVTFRFRTLKQSYQPAFTCGIGMSLCYRLGCAVRLHTNSLEDYPSNKQSGNLYM